MAVAAIGLTPMSPVMVVAPVVEMPDFAKIAKLPAEPRLTVDGPAASSGAGLKKPTINASANALIKTLSMLLMIVFMDVFLVTNYFFNLLFYL